MITIDPNNSSSAHGCCARQIPSVPGRTCRRSLGLDVTSVVFGNMAQYHLTLRPLPNETPQSTVARLGDALKQQRAVIVRMEVFGLISVREEVMGALQAVCGPDIPVTYVEGRSCNGQALAGMHVLAVSGVQVQTHQYQGRPIARSFSDPWACHMLFGDLHASNNAASKEEQAQETYESLLTVLSENGMGMVNVARTWLFVDSILCWYGTLNAVRNAFYQKQNVYQNLVPASTGVSGCNASGTAMVAGAWASVPLNSSFSLKEVISPKQCEATDYGSSFSRAVELVTPGYRHVMVSGTASIEPGGQSVHGGDMAAQISLTMEVILAILQSRQMGWADVSRATAYIKYPKDVVHFEKWLTANGLEDWPVIRVDSHICREELLFEVELDALKA